MTWVKLSDSALDDPRLLPLGRGAVLLHLEALSLSNRHGLDGAIPRGALHKMTSEPDPEAAAASLVDAGLWEATDSGWQLVWLLDDQPKAADVERERTAAKERMRGIRGRDRLHKRGDHSLCDPKRCWVLRSPERSPERTPARSGTPSPPVSVPIGGEEEGEGQEAGDATAAAGGAEPAAAASPAEMRWLPVTADDYERTEWRDNFLRCDRCRGLFLNDLFPEEAIEEFMCPYCSEVARRRRGKDCLAFTRAKKDAPSRPCHQRRPVGSRWCRYHERDDSRGQAPIESRHPIDDAADKAIARLSEPKPEPVEEPVNAEAAEDAANVREAIRLWLKHRPNEPVPATREDLRKWLVLARHDQPPDALAEASVTAWCRDFRAHQTFHKQIASGIWWCAECRIGVEVPV